MITRLLISFFIFFFTINTFSQKKQTNEQYIEKYYKIAIEEMQKYKIPASITLAQGILESGSGNSDLAKKAKNHFGIKCHSSWKGKRYFMDDDEKDECFRVYKNPKSSFEDHSAFLTNRGRYEFLFTDYATTDYKKWAKGLKKAGYATNPKYPNLLIDLIERYHLYKYDRIDFVPEETVQKDVLVLEEVEEETFVLEETNEYIKALMGRNVYYSDAKKGIFIFNRIKTIKAKGRTPLEIAVLFGVNFERLKKYNDLVGDEKFKEGQNVFLQPKRFKGSQKDYLVKPGDSMWDISQMFGIKMSSLLKKNLLAPGQQAKPGETLMLRKKRKTEIQTIAYKEVLKTKRLIEAEKPKRVVNKTFIKPLGTTIDIIQESKDVEVEKPKVFKPAQIQELEVIEPVNPVEVVDKYPIGKYVEKNEELEKLINEIPVVKSSQTNESKPNTNVKSGLTHKVKQGETLYFISRKYNVSVDELKILNNLQDNGINIGQDLIILQK
jgi:LysM repeat protein